MQDANKCLILCTGYTRKVIENKYDPRDIAGLVNKYLFVDWKWDYCYNENSETNDKYKITSDRKTFECNYNKWWYCFARCDIEMPPNSGIYGIKMKINKIYDCEFNCIGITTNTDKYNNNPLNVENETKHKGECDWYFSNDYLAWSVSGELDKTYFKHGLLCGLTENQHSNIFYKNGFKYESNNKYNIDSLPQINDNDIITILYDSTKNTLNFIKENDTKCDSTIANLPKNVSCYWFIGHTKAEMNISILQ